MRLTDVCTNPIYGVFANAFVTFYSLASRDYLRISDRETKGTVILPSIGTISMLLNCWKSQERGQCQLKANSAPFARTVVAEEKSPVVSEDF
jgi:hypothetical protein